MNAKGPKRAFSRPSRPRRKRSRIVAPTPPARMNPVPSAPAATTGSRARSLPATSVASPSPARRSSTASASCSRSLAIARRTSCVVRLLVAAIALERLRRQPRFGDGLLWDGRHALLDHPEPDEGEEARQKRQASEHDHEREPSREHGRERRGDRCEAEPQSEEEEDSRPADEPDPET